jgi:hypothetical protein
LFGLYFCTKLRNNVRYYDIAPYDRIAAGAGKETPQMRGFWQAAVLQVPFAAKIKSSQTGCLQVLFLPKKWVCRLF